MMKNDSLLRFRRFGRNFVGGRKKPQCISVDTRPAFLPVRPCFAQTRKMLGTKPFFTTLPRLLFQNLIKNATLSRL
jgi:hypothetical protein